MNAEENLKHCELNKKDSGDLFGISVEHASLNKLIKIALQEFDENGCVSHPPSITIVLLTMHEWFLSSKAFFKKVVKIYEKHKLFGDLRTPTNDSVFDSQLPQHSFSSNTDSGVLTSISELDNENSDLDSKTPLASNTFDLNPETPIDSITQSTSRAQVVNGPEFVEIDQISNNNNNDEHVLTISAPQFDVALNEPCVVGHAQLASETSLEIPEVTVTCVEEKHTSQRSRNDTVKYEDNKSETEADDFSDPENDTDTFHVVFTKWVVCQFLHYWMSKFGTTLRTNDVMYDINDFKKSLINGNKDDERQIRHLIGRSALGIPELSSHSTKLVRQKEISRTKSLAFKDLSPKDIAEQLTHIDCKSLRRIPMTEWKTYARKPKLSHVPNLERYVVQFNGLSRWIEAMVLNGETSEMRAHVVEKFLSVAECLRSHQNFNSLLAVIGALNHSALRRLHQTMGLLSTNKKSFLDEMTQLLSSEGNYANYRKELSECRGFYVPILGVHLKDLIAVDTALPDFLPDTKLINFQKMVKFYTVIATLMNFKNMQPPAPSKFELINMLRLSIQMSISEDELYELSYAREPRRASCLSDKSEEESQLLFADWASGRVTSPDTRTIDRHVTSMVEAVFKFYDRDSDGLLTTEDFEGISSNFPFVDSFGIIDADSDGVLTKEEMKNYFLKANYRALGKDFIHYFQETTYLTPNFCEHCGGVLWGLIKQGFKCKDCGINCHKACKDQVVIDCRVKSLTVPTSNLSNSFSTLERAANKAEAIRNKWKNKRKSKIMANEEIEATKAEETHTDGRDDFAMKLQRTDEACKVLLTENKKLKDDNDKVNSELNQAYDKIRHLESQLKLVRQETISFVLEQLDALQLRRNTAV